jgi:hypothetical protein
VAIAHEIGRWDVTNDFMIINGKLEYSNTGLLMCGSSGVSCPQITALLRLQDSASAGIPSHDPYHYRATLSDWYNDQKAQFTTMVDDMLHVDQGVYQIRNQNSGKLMVPQSGSTTSGAPVQQSDLYNASTASQWRVTLNGTRQQLKNVKSGLCLDLQTNTTGTTNMVQRSCSTASTQGFRLAQQSAAVFWIRTSAGALTIASASKSNGAYIQQQGFGLGSHQYFTLEPVGTEPHSDLLATATAVYNLKVAHSGQAMAVSAVSLADGLSVIQQPYASADKRFHWYITPVGTRLVQGVPSMTYQLINRRTGKCLDTTATTPYKAVQSTCSQAETQRFLFVPVGDGTKVIYTYHGVTLGVSGGSTSSGAQFVEGGSTWQSYNRLTLEPIMAGEPHVLTWSHQTNDGPCGVYDWFDITRPNGLPLENPSSSFVQLIFAGGKQSASGTDQNPYIAQRVSGDQVAIDPTYGLEESGSTSAGACYASCVKISTTSLTGACCSCNAVSKKFVRSTWNPSTYLCQ